LLGENGESVRAARVEDAVAAPDQELDTFLRSNDLWGGSGSIADCAGMIGGQRTDGTRKIEHALIQLGNEQIRAGKVDQRTAMWVETFSKWEKAGI
jgi:hypothetical protein